MTMDETLEKVLQAITVPVVKDRVVKRQRRGNRMKVYDNGYIFTYDKDSQCGQRSFWRCERKSECPARVHTNPATNQIIKRINEHTHEAPNREELPPWLLLNQSDNVEEQSVSPASQTSTTGILLPYPNANSSIHLSGMIDNELDVENDQIVESLPKIKTEVSRMEMPEHGPPPAKRRMRREHNSYAIDHTMENSEQFWDLFEATRNFAELIKRNVEQGTYPRPGPSSAPINVYLAVADEIEVVDSQDVVYQMVTLTHKTVAELREMAEKRNLFVSDDIKMICIEGPMGITVELSDQLMSTWTNESVYKLSINKNICKMWKKIH